MKFSLRDEPVTKYCKAFKDYVSKIQSSNKKLCDRLNNLLKASEYLRFQKLIKDTLDYYDELIIRDIKNSAFNNWRDSENSLHYFIDSFECGTSAVANAKSIEDRIQTIMATTLKVEIEIYRESKNPVIRDSDFDKALEALNIFKTEIYEAHVKHRGRLIQETEDNEIFSTLVALVDNINNKLSEFCKTSESSINKLHEQVIKESKAREDKFMNSEAGKNARRAIKIAERTSSADSKPENAGEKSSKNSSKTKKDGSKISEDNLKRLIEALEQLVNELGASNINDAVEKHADDIIELSRRLGETKDKSSNNSHKDEVKPNEFGRYYVTPETINLMDNMVYRVHHDLEIADKFYKEKLSSTEEGKAFGIAQMVLSGLSNLFSKLAIDPYDVTQDFKSQAESKSLSLLTYSLKLSPEIVGGAMVASGGVNVLNEAMPKIQENKTLSKIKSKVWDSYKKFNQNPGVNNYLALYMYEHYQMKLSGNFNESGAFIIYHKAVKNADEKFRRSFEDAILAADIYFCNKHGGLRGQFKQDNIRTGALLNLVRAGLVDRHEINPETGNSLTDKLYNSYVSTLALKPDTKIDPLTGKNIDNTED